MSRYLTLLLAALMIPIVIGCEKSKLRDDMMGDSTWESFFIAIGSKNSVIASLRNT